MNDYSKISAESEVERLAVITPEETPIEQVPSIEAEITFEQIQADLSALSKQIHSEIDHLIGLPSWDETFNARYRAQTHGQV
jgi:hypothetical protein